MKEIETKAVKEITEEITELVNLKSLLQEIEGELGKAEAQNEKLLNEISHQKLLNFQYEHSLRVYLNKYSDCMRLIYEIKELTEKYYNSEFEPTCLVPLGNILSKITEFLTEDKRCKLSKDEGNDE